MPKGGLNKGDTGDFKQMVVETMIQENFGLHEAAHRFDVYV